jgi:FtsH-binding integral membrane protein
MKALRLREMLSSYYFWPGAALLALAIGMAIWAWTLLREDWAGQVMWSVVFALVAAILIVLAWRESRPHPRRSAT